MKRYDWFAWCAAGPEQTPEGSDERGSGGQRLHSGPRASEAIPCRVYSGLEGMPPPPLCMQLW